MLKILQARLQQYMSRELPDVQARFRKGRRPRTNCQHPLDHRKSKRIPEKNISFISYTKSLWLCRSKKKNCGKFLKRWEYQTTLPAFCGTGMQVKKQQLEPDMEKWTGSKLGKRVRQGCILSPCLFNFYSEYIMWHARLDNSQASIKIARRYREEIGKRIFFLFPLWLYLLKAEITLCIWTWNNSLVPNRRRSTSRLYIVTLLI